MSNFLKRTKYLIIVLLLIIPLNNGYASSKLVTKNQYLKILHKQQNQIDSLLKTTQLNKDQLNIIADNLETNFDATLSSSWWNKTSIGGYGELHFNTGKIVDQIDFHRFVLFVNHEFNDKIRFFSELELEHAESGDGKEGEIELEQAYIEYNLSDKLLAKTGLILVPIGILNEVHEPNTFYGVERNPIEKNIIPSSWWEAAISINKQFDKGFTFDLMVHSGLNSDTSDSKAFNIRSGRQKASKAIAKSGAITARIKYTAIPGIEIASSIQYQQDITQGSADKNASASLFSAHIDMEKSGFGLRALYARWDINSSLASNNGNDEQYGYYIEPSYKFNFNDKALGLFMRYNYYDNYATSSDNTEIQQIDVGINFWPIEQIALKADIAFVNKQNSGIDDKIFNLGIGFQF